MKGFRDDLLDRLAASNPVPPATVAGEARSFEGRRLAREIASTPGRGRFRRALTAGSAVAAALVTALLVTQVIPDSGRGATAAAKALLAASDVAEGQQWAGTPSGFRYLETEVSQRHSLETGGAISTVIVRSVRELWIAPDGAGRLRATEIRPLFLTPDDEQAWLDAGRPSFDIAADDTFGAGELWYPHLSALPTEVEDLERVLLDSAKSGDRPLEVELLVQIADLLRLPDASPELRAALYRVAAGVGGVQLLGDVTDESGRTGTGVGIEYEESGDMLRTTILFDPDSSDVLEIRTEYLEPVTWTDATPPFVVDYTLYLDSGIVDSTSERP